MLPAAQLAIIWAFVAHAHGLQARPVPKYPELHLHVDTSVAVLPEQGLATVAFCEHVLHAEHVAPSP